MTATDSPPAGMATIEQEGSAGSEVLPQTRRPDGSLRPAVRVKKGYIPPEEQQKYDRWKSEPQTGGPPGAGGAEEQAAQKAASKTALKNQKRKEKKKQEVDAAPRTSQKSHTSSGQAEEQRTEADGAAPPDDNGESGAEAASEKAAADLSAAADAAMGEVEKKLKALKKRLRQVQDLVDKKAGGAALNADQENKVSSKPALEAEIARWEALGDIDIGKKIKALKKKTRQIQELEERQRGGEVLNADQLGKLEHKTEVVSELQLLEDMFSKM